MPECAPGSALLTIPALCLKSLPVRILGDVHDGVTHLALPDLPLPEYRAIIAALYCQPGQWNARAKGELRAAWEYMRAGLRMYPLAEAK
jgi:hypothetical protein